MDSSVYTNESLVEVARDRGTQRTYDVVGMRHICAMRET